MEPQQKPQTVPSPRRSRPSSTAAGQAIPRCSSTTRAGRPCSNLAALPDPVCPLHRMTAEERRQAGLLGSLVLRSRIRKEQAAAAQDVAHEAAAGLQEPGTGVPRLMPDFRSPTSIGEFLSTIADRVTRRELAPSQAAAATSAAVAALRALELANEINLLSREVAVVRDRLAPAPGGWTRGR